MDVIEVVNVTAGAFALVLVIALIVGMSQRGPAIRKRRFLLIAMAAQFVTLTGDLLVRLLAHRPGTAARVAIEAGTFLRSTAAILACVAIMIFVYTDASEKPVAYARREPLVLFLWVLNGTNLALVLTNPATQLYYRVTEANAVSPGPLAWLYELLMLTQTVLMVPVVVRLHARHGRWTTIRLLLCGLVIGMAAAIDVVWDGLRLTTPAVSIVLVILSVGVQMRLEEDLVQARAEAAESRVRLLSGQIHPHFVFNSLTAIKALVSENPELAESAIQDFSDYLRSHLDVMSAARMVPFPTEIDHVRHYVALEQADPVRPLEVSYELEVEDFLVPPLTVQPLVENAIRHGIRTREEGGHVSIASRRSSGGIEVVVSDDGRGFSSATQRQNQRSRVGIDNVRERIERQCGGSLVVRSDELGTVAMMLIPESEGA